MTRSPESVTRAAADVAATHPHVAVLLEGRSDQAAIRALAAKRSREIRYGRLLVEALDVDRIPAPLDAVLADV